MLSQAAMALCLSTPYGLAARVGEGGNALGSHVLPMTLDTRIALFLMGELVAVLQANNPKSSSGGRHNNSRHINE